jgi:hypothetical protein
VRLGTAATAGGRDVSKRRDTLEGERRPALSFLVSSLDREGSVVYQRGRRKR